jgi:hypothetical protein
MDPHSFLFQVAAMVNENGNLGAFSIEAYGLLVTKSDFTSGKILINSKHNIYLLFDKSIISYKNDFVNLFFRRYTSKKIVAAVAASLGRSLIDQLAVLALLNPALLGAEATGAAPISILKSEPVKSVFCHFNYLLFDKSIISHIFLFVKSVFRRNTSKHWLMSADGGQSTYL